jgi:asparagine synthase (glutamine-hydrolysing)
MCGIFGLYNINVKESFDRERIQKAISFMDHRGPDASGIKIFDDKCVLAHKRLSILDLEPISNQPFQINENYWISFNGEIYNYIEIKEELLEKGYLFRSNSDTEVLLNSYIEWGHTCVDHFNGMWAFAIYDVVKNEIFCSRDRFGVKPFNYVVHNGQFIFSSEIKPIISYSPELKVPNYKIISNYVRTSLGAQTTETWFEGINRLPPAHNILIDKDGFKLFRYWDYPRKVNKKLNYNDALKEYSSLFENAVSIRMRSDVPVGITLSSGLDSSSIACVQKKNNSDIQKTYTANFQTNKFHKSEKANFSTNITIDEPSIVKKLTSEIGLLPTFINVDYTNYVERLKRIIWYLESGHGSPAIYPLDQVLDRAKDDVTVILEGQGADELLGGYISNIMPHMFIDLLSKLKFKKAFDEIKIFSKNYSLLTTLKLYVRTSNFNFLKKIFYRFSGMQKVLIGSLKGHSSINDYPIKPEGFDDRINEHLYKAHTGGLVNLLHYGDAISMSHSMESRLPFMDFRLVEYAFKLPSEYKVKFGLGKYIHRVAMKNIVPNYILMSPVKFGFESPLKHLFLDHSDNSPRSILLSEKFLSRGLFSNKIILKYLRDLEEGKKDYSRVLFRILSVELWFQNFIDNEFI